MRETYRSKSSKNVFFFINQLSAQIMASRAG